MLEAYYHEGRRETFGFAKQLILLGGIEGAFSLICAAKLDKNADGLITAVELEIYREESKAVIENALNQYLNNGVVAALILSIVVPLALQPVDVGDECNDRFGADACHIFQILSFITVQIIFTSSLVLLYLSTVSYKQLSFWMPDLTSQLWFINEAKLTFSFTAIGTMVLLLALPIFVFFTGMCYSPWAGGVASIPMAAFFICFLVQETIARSMWPYVHERAKHLLLPRAAPS